MQIAKVKIKAKNILGQHPLTEEQKIIKSKLGLLESAKQLSNILQTCKALGDMRGADFTDSKNYTRKEENAPFRRQAVKSRAIQIEQPKHKRISITLRRKRHLSQARP
ncbi:MAG: hypothetical protein HY026_00660 [Deltaproteobacteria bacterium]|nr:hypothetical protein [Deltaproteobacteria bacterium]